MAAALEALLHLYHNIQRGVMSMKKIIIMIAINTAIQVAVLVALLMK